MKKFSLAHILSVALDRTLVSPSELMRFLEFMCDHKLEKIHAAAASDLCVLPLVSQFPWLDKIKTDSLDRSLRVLANSAECLVEGQASTSLSKVSTKESEEYLQAEAAVKRQWLSSLENKYGKEFEVKSLKELGAKPFSKGYFNHWWLNNIAHR